MSGAAPDVLVIGGGAIGVAVAYEVARRGGEVALVERARLASGCSAGNAGLICPSHSAPLATRRVLRDGIVWMTRRDSPLYVRPRPAIAPWLFRFALATSTKRVAAGKDLLRRLSIAALALHVELYRNGLDTGFTRRGIMNLYETEAGFTAGRAEAEENLRNDLVVDVLTQEAAIEREPALSTAIVGATYYPDEAHCDPLRFVQALGRAATQSGADIRTGVEVLGFEREEGRVAVWTTAGRLRPATVILAAGAWTRALARQVGVFVPLEGAKGYHLDLEPARSDPGMPVFMQESRVIATPLQGRLRLAGTLELAGLDLRVDPTRVEALLRAARRNLRGLGDRAVLSVWRGLRPTAPDGLPIIGRPKAVANLVVATGHAMLGLTLAPITAKLVADLLAGERPPELEAMSPDRFKSLSSFRGRSRADCDPHPC